MEKLLYGNKEGHDMKKIYEKIIRLLSEDYRCWASGHLHMWRQRDFQSMGRCFQSSEISKREQN